MRIDAIDASIGAIDVGIDTIDASIDAIDGDIDATDRPIGKRDFDRRSISQGRSVHHSARVPRTMTKAICPVCSLEDVLSHAEHFECATCGNEWPRQAPAEVARIVKDANGTPLANGDTVTLIKDLKLKGSSEVLKQGTKAKNIRLVDGDHEIDCKIDGSAMALKACFVKKA